jgi:hypothetical protein
MLRGDRILRYCGDRGAEISPRSDISRVLAHCSRFATILLSTVTDTDET